jgi:hypothetical protein
MSSPPTAYTVPLPGPARPERMQCAYSRLQQSTNALTQGTPLVARLVAGLLGPGSLNVFFDSGSRPTPSVSRVTDAQVPLSPFYTLVRHIRIKLAKAVQYARYQSCLN